MFENIMIALHLLVSLTLIVLVLLHSGKGGGLSDMFGGGMGPMGGTSSVMEKNLDRLTVGVGIAFGITTLTLTFIGIDS